MLTDYINRSSQCGDHSLEILRSLDRYDSIFLYHLDGARNAMDEVIGTERQVSIEVLEVILGISDKQRGYHTAKIESEAHVLGLAHSVRAMCDVFSFLVNSIVLHGAVALRHCNVHTVSTRLPTCMLKDRLQRLLESYWFKYTSAFINTSKHRMLVHQPFSVDFESGYAGVSIDEFKFDDSEFPRYRLKDYLEGVIGVKNAVVGCGRALNRQLNDDSTGRMEPHLSSPQ